MRNYQTYEEISEALRNGEVRGALVDLYVLSSHNHLFDDPRFRIVRVYDYKASYGVVLAGHSMKLEKCFKEYTKGNAEEVFRRIEQNINSLKVRALLFILLFFDKPLLGCCTTSNYIDYHVTYIA